MEAVYNETPFTVEKNSVSIRIQTQTGSSAGKIIEPKLLHLRSMDETYN